ncbi:hypothetical protein IJT93_03290 [bacterium]|nr:hypothetical protein [bacterium]
MAADISCRRILLWSVSALLCLNASACSSVDFTEQSSGADEGVYAEAPSIKNHPIELTKSFLNNIRNGKYKEAYGLLSVDAKINLNYQRFEKELTRYMSSASTKSVYVTRVAVNEQITGNTAIVTLEDSKYPTAALWTWEFEKTQAGWRIRSLDLPPLCQYRAKKDYTSNNQPNRRRRHRRRR